ncbi:MAG: M14 family metallocarboxypeptidase [Verrucomicrobia bacterium]|nr:M14 family metallocarboxypeptidase [Verrucomicrobiota bacterium]
MQRLDKNLGGYRGEGIDIQKVLEDIKIAAEQTGWRPDSFSIPNGQDLVAYHRRGTKPQNRLYLSTGIHGDEPAGPLAILEMLRENHWPDHIDLWLCPCINLTGFPLNTRENASGIDLNRDYRHGQSPEVRTHIAWLAQQPEFDLAVCLHEDWEANGFYLYELNPDNRLSPAEKIIQNVSRVCPIETADTIDGWPAKAGIIRPDISPEDREQWPEALFLLTHKTRQTYTFESPSDFPITTRVQAQIAAVRTVLESI